MGFKPITLQTYFTTGRSSEDRTDNKVHEYHKLLKVRLPLYRWKNFSLRLNKKCWIGLNSLRNHQIKWLKRGKANSRSSPNPNTLRVILSLSGLKPERKSERQKAKGNAKSAVKNSKLKKQGWWQKSFCRRGSITCVLSKNKSSDLRVIDLLRSVDGGKKENRYAAQIAECRGNPKKAYKR